MVVGDDSTETRFTLKKDPRIEASQDDLQAQFDFLITLRDELSTTHRAIERIRAVRAQVNGVLERAAGTEVHEELEAAAEPLLERMGEIERALYQTKNRSRQDPLNFPIRLNNKLAALARSASIGPFRPTDQARAVHAELKARIDTELDALAGLIDREVPRFNALVAEKQVPAIRLEEESALDRP